MFLIPDFKIGWCNGWLGTIPIILPMIILFISNKGAAKRAVNMSAYTVKEKCQTFVSTFVFFGAVLYSVGLPLRLETMWFYIGLTVYASGSIIVDLVDLGSGRGKGVRLYRLISKKGFIWGL